MKLTKKDNVTKVETKFGAVRLYRRLGDDKKVVEEYKLKNYYFKNDENGKFTDIFDKKCSIVYYEGKMHATPDTNHELDISLDEHFAIRLARRKLLGRPKKYRVMHFDIETNGSIDTVNTPAEIISITSYDSFNDEYRFFALARDDKDLSDEVYKDEKLMLQDFYEYLKKFDILTAWNGIKFDFPYLINRCKKLDIKIDAYVTQFGSNKAWGGRSLKSKMAGVNLIDLLVVFMKVIEWLPKKPADYRLDTIAYTFLEDIRKIALEVTPGELWKQKRFKELKEYNIMDVKIMVELDKKFGLIQFLQNTQELAPALDIENVPYNSRIIDSYLLTHHDKVFPSKKFSDNKEFVVSGATVLDPVAGFHNNVAIFDFSGMYQNIIRTFNISPDTIDPKGDIKLGDTTFTSQKTGLLNILVTDFINLRKEIQKIKHSYEGVDEEMLQLYFYKECMVKKITNSVYGVFAYSGFRLYDPRVANAITWVGRQLIKYIEDTSKENGFTVIYGDTDSVFLKKKELDKCTDTQLILKTMEDFNTKLNNGLTDFVRKLTTNEELAKNHTLKIEFETLFTEMVMTDAKKKYTGYVVKWKNALLKKPKLFYHGIDLSRKDTPVAIKKIIEEVVCDVFEHKPMQEIQDKIKLARNILKNTPARDLMINKNLTQEIDEYKVMPQHARAAKYSNDNFKTNFSKENYKGGMLYVVVTHKYPQTDVILLEPEMEVPDGIKINIEKYFDMFVRRKLMLIFGEDFYMKNMEFDNLTKWLK